MKYRLGDICTITKGATGIMKAVPGLYPMVTLAEERKQHDEYQFDAAAVIVPLISSTGHGHASIKRIHYQEGKFALGTILCAVIPKDAALLNPRYLFVYLQQFKDSVLVPLMKGAANVSLPMNKLAALEIEVPSLVKQQEVIDLAHVLTGHKDDLEALLDAQQEDTVKLRQALLREAMQGQLLPQDPTDEPAAELLKKLQAAKAATAKGGKRKAGALFAEEAEAVEGPFEIPASWVWCRFGDYVIFERGKFSARPRNDPHYFGGEHLFIQIGSLDAHGTTIKSAPQTLNDAGLKVSKKFKAGTIAIAIVGGTIGNMGVLGVDMCFPDSVIGIQPKDNICQGFVLYALRAKQEEIKGFANQMSGQPNIKIPTLANLIIPLPPLAEQHRIVVKLELLMQHCDALEQRIRESRRLAEQLLQTALREALAPPAGSAPVEPEPELLAAAAAPEPPRRGRGRPPKATAQPDGSSQITFDGLL